MIGEKNENIVKAVLDLYQLSNQQSPYSPILIQHVATQGTFSYRSSFLKRAMKFWRNLQVDLRYADYCLVLLQVPKTFVTVQIFWGRLMVCPFTGPKILVQIFWTSQKIWLHLVPLQKLLCRHKNQFYWMQIIFLSGTKCLWLAQYVNKFLVRHKNFGTAQNILQPVIGQGIK